MNSFTWYLLGLLTIPAYIIFWLMFTIAKELFVRTVALIPWEDKDYSFVTWSTDRTAVAFTAKFKPAIGLALRIPWRPTVSNFQKQWEFPLRDSNSH